MTAASVSGTWFAIAAGNGRRQISQRAIGRQITQLPLDDLLRILAEIVRDGLDADLDSTSGLWWIWVRLAQFVLPPLTTAQMSQAELARRAFHALLSDVQRDIPAPEGTEYVLKTSLVLRESTALAPRSQRPAGSSNR